jgi:hypothetical protein
MTLKELSQLHHLRKEIETNQQRLKELEILSLQPAGPKLSDASRSTGNRASRQEKLYEEKERLLMLIAAQQIQCICERQRLQEYIASIPDSYLRNIFYLRFDRDLGWNEVAASIGGGTTIDACKKACYRYIRKH